MLRFWTAELHLIAADAYGLCIYRERERALTGHCLQKGNQWSQPASQPSRQRETAHTLAQASGTGPRAEFAGHMGQTIGMNSPLGTAPSSLSLTLFVSHSFSYFVHPSLFFPLPLSVSPHSTPLSSSLSLSLSSSFFLSVQLLQSSLSLLKFILIFKQPRWALWANRGEMWIYVIKYWCL